MTRRTFESEEAKVPDSALAQNAGSPLDYLTADDRRKLNKLLRGTATLDEEVRDSLVMVLQAEQARRLKGGGVAEPWLAQVRANEMSLENLKRLGLNVDDGSSLNECPGFKNTFLYALASNTFHTDEFVAYGEAMGYQFWATDQERADCLEVTSLIWKQPAPDVPILLMHLYRHLLRNLPALAPWNDEDDESDWAEPGDNVVEFRVAPSNTGLINAQNPTTDAPDTTAEPFDASATDETNVVFAPQASTAENPVDQGSYPILEALKETIHDKVTTLPAEGLKNLSGFLFTSPSGITLVIRERSEETKRDEGVIALLLLAHILLAHVDRTRFQVWFEYEPGRTPRKLLYDLARRFAEQEADDFVAGLLDPQLRNRTLLTGHTTRLAALIEMGLPVNWTQNLLIAVKRKQEITLWFLGLIHSLPVVRRRRLGVGQLVTGADRHVYYITGDNTEVRRHWVCSYALLTTSCKKAQVHKVPERVLRRTSEGSFIATLNDAAEVGLYNPSAASVKHGLPPHRNRHLVPML